ncbi:Peptidase M28 OS=Koribacter versatilis (strain Ellin345) GN=Acid345_2940 PE=4 SV=1: Peptidase_M28 [Gemmataceae bacterium]|nr:Peptidase M28 OS=Koribacter versatilis (strain Ellin345) GN=Acid345_2940 PE=4 SV=1: Peptidase_M28 [Gemmataceae bacterium]VTT98105.1 Peptidase M28 OS=Koribacter versatilis (strain Ellin345) GN=Acid345_2940 PE=4 SV=1: Peptidase_M28 [Gemmataceae bacterium]
MPRPAFAAAAFLGLALALSPTTTRSAELAPAPRGSSAALDALLLAEVKERSELMKNLQYMSDVIGPRLTGSKNLERANNWTAEKMKAYGLENVRLEPWEIPVGWVRGKATMRLVDPDNGRELAIASYGWTPGTGGKKTGKVVVLTARTKADLDAHRGKLKDATVLLSAPKEVKPITDLNYPAPAGPSAGQPRKDEPKLPDPKSSTDPKATDLRQSGLDAVTEFLKAEGAACVCTDAGKPHGLLVTTGGWPADRAAAEARLPRVFMAHEHYALLHRLATRPDATTKVEVEIENTFVPGPVTVYNTVGEVTGGEKPDEFVVVGAHLDSWELASGTTDNATGSCVVLEIARTVAALAKAGERPRRTIRFVLFTGEEQGLHGSKKYCERHKDELPRHSAALVHDTGTGKVHGLGLHGRTAVREVLEPQLGALAKVDGWKGLDMRGMGGTDHLSFHAAGVPGFACLQDIDEYRLTHHTQSDTFDKAKEPNLVQGAQVLGVAVVRIANLPELLPRK